jgi:hypothetical protein
MTLIGTSYSPPVKPKSGGCGSRIEMSPLTAELKCPHERGKDNNESEAVTEVPGDEFG